MNKNASHNWREHPDLVAFYTQHRNRVEDLYPSEKRFLPWLARQAITILDVGCGAGGFKNVWQHYQPAIHYAGVDVSASLINMARKRFPDSQFYHGNCADGLKLPDRCATIVSALGWLHWEVRYHEALRELWRLTDRYLFFDVRLVDKPAKATVAQQKLMFAGDWDGHTTVPYLTIAWPAFAELLLELRPSEIMAHGYWGKPSETVVGIDHALCFAAFVVKKSPKNTNMPTPEVCVDLPWQWPEKLLERVRSVPSLELLTRVPPSEPL